MAPCPTLNSGGESRSSPVPLFAHFHVLTALGGTHLVQDSYLLKKPKAQETSSWKAAAAWELGRRTEMFKAFTGTAAGPQDMEEHRWAALRQVFSRTFLFREEKNEVHAIAQSSPIRMWPLAVSPALIPQQPAESWKGRGLPQCQLQTCFVLRTQQVITEHGRTFLGTMQSKEFLTFHHDVFAPLKDKQNKTCLNRRDTGRDFNIFSNNWGRAFPAGQVSVTCTLEGHNF